MSFGIHLEGAEGDPLRVHQRLVLLCDACTSKKIVDGLQSALPDGWSFINFGSKNADRYQLRRFDWCPECTDDVEEMLRRHLKLRRA
jgi:hypothetical protein